MTRRHRLTKTCLLASAVCALSFQSLADVNLPGECVFPEGVTATADGTLYAGSMQHGAIYRAAPNSLDAEVFVQPHDNGLVATLGIYADEPRGRLIACSADPGIAHTKVGDDSFTGKAGSGIRIFDLKTGKAQASIDFPGGGFCNDIAVDAEGTIYATDTFNGRILRSVDGGIDIWAMGGVLADRPWTLIGVDYLSDDNALIVGNQATGQLFKIAIGDDGAASKIEDLKLSRPLNVPDGVRLLDRSTVGVIEAGTGTYSAVSLADGKVTEIADKLPAPATFALARGKAWVTSAQGDQFWPADSDCAKAKQPFRLIEVPQR